MEHDQFDRRFSDRESAVQIAVKIKNDADRLIAVISQKDNIIAETSAAAENSLLISATNKMTYYQYIRQIISNRTSRTKFFPQELFSDPAWDIILYLALMNSQSKQASVKSLCMASGVPTTTALRCINALIEKGICERQPDRFDKRRVYIGMSEKGMSALDQYFANQWKKGNETTLQT